MEANPYYLKDTNGNYYNQYPEFQIWEEGKHSGILEVVEWVKANIHPHIMDGRAVLVIYDRDMASKLKDWGIK